MQTKPILFSGAMVKAILSGSKTMTRRAVTPQPPSNWGGKSEVFALAKQCPYGQNGDRLWVRESLYLGEDNAWRYKADDSIVYCGAEGIAWAHHKDTEHCPSIHMPRWASRITLGITGVRAERLQDISEADAKAEGVAAWHDTANGTVYRPEFQMLWDAINGKRGYSWESNPWVFVVEFELLQG